MSRLALWRRTDAIAEPRLNRAKAVLLTLIAVTSLLALAFVRPEEAPLVVNVYKYRAKTGAFLGSMFMIWQWPHHPGHVAAGVLVAARRARSFHQTGRRRGPRGWP